MTTLLLGKELWYPFSSRQGGPWSWFEHFKKKADFLNPRYSAHVVTVLTSLFQLSHWQYLVIFLCYKSATCMNHCSSCLVVPHLVLFKPVTFLSDSLFWMVREYVTTYSMMLLCFKKVKKLWFDPQQVQEFIPFSSMGTPVVGSTQQLGWRLTIHLCPAPKLRRHGALPLLPFMLSWHTQERH
jgi:hypothetical protein